jgi:hypothetical protein
MFFVPQGLPTPAGSMPAKEDNDAGRKTGRFLSLGSSHISIRMNNIGSACFLRLEAKVKNRPESTDSGRF